VADFVIPELGENVAGGDVVRLLVKAGDALKKDQPVLELETDKATIEVPSNVGGVVKDVKVKTGDKVKVGQLVLTVDESASAAAPAPAAAATADKPAPAAAPVDKPAAAPVDGTPNAPPSKVVDISRGAAPRPAPTPAAPPASNAAAQVPAAPSTRRYARELGVDITDVDGSGPGGRVSMDDVKGHARSIITSGGGRRVASQPLPDFSQWGAVETKSFDTIRKETAKQMSLAWSLTERTSGATDERKLNKRLIVQRTKYGGARDRSYVWPRGRQDDRWSTAQSRAAEQLRVRKIKAGKVLRIVDLNPAIAVCLEPNFNVVIDTDVEAQRHVNDVNVARITIEIAVRNAERELPAAQS